MSDKDAVDELIDDLLAVVGRHILASKLNMPFEDYDMMLRARLKKSLVRALQAYNK